MKAKIYRPAKTAMQSGKANTRLWILEMEQSQKRFTDPLMGWTGSSDMNQEVKLKFSTEAEAVNYAKSRGVDYEIIEPKTAKVIIKSYAENFK